MNNTKNKQLTVAIQIRVSGNSQKDGYSIPFQADVALEHIKKYGFKANTKHLKDILENYQDEHQIRNFRGKPLVYLEDGVSATAFNQDRSEEYSRMIRDAEAGKYDVLMTIKVDRMSRSQEQNLRMVRELNEDNGIRVIVIEDRIDTDDKNWKDIYRLRAWLADMEARQIKFRMDSGRKRKMKEKKRVGDWPFGYNPIKDDTGKWNGLLEKNEEQAHWVTEIFRWYVDEGLSTGRIAKRLNEKGIRTKLGTEWSGDSIIYLLSNETYTGRQSRKHLADKYDTDIPDFECPPIISKKHFEKVRKKREINAREMRRPPKREYLFRDKVFCKICGAKFYGRTKYPGRKGEYTCYRSSPKTACVDTRRCGRISEKDLIASVIPAVIRLFLSPEASKKLSTRPLNVDGKIADKLKDEEKIIRKLKEDLKRTEYGFVNKIISESTALEIKGKLEPQLELHQRNFEELTQDHLLSEEKRRHIKTRLLHWNLSLRCKSGKEFSNNLLLIAHSLLDRLYIDCKSKRTRITLQVPGFTHEFTLDNSANEKFLQNPEVISALNKSYVLHQGYRSNINPSVIPQQNGAVIAGTSKDDYAITARKKQSVKVYAPLSEDNKTKEGREPVKYSLTIPYGRVNKEKAA